MSAKFGGLKLPVVLILVVGGVWTLGTLRAEMDLPIPRSLQGDPLVVDGFAGVVNYESAPEDMDPAEAHFIIAVDGAPRRLSLHSS